MDDRHDSDVELENLKRDGSFDLDIGEGELNEAETFLEQSVATAVLSWQEKKNIALIFTLYFVDALPMMFTWVTMPILLRQQLNYTLIGTYYISQYPWSIKVLWSPIVQSKYIPFLGKRKSWLFPCFLGGGLVLYWLAYHQDDLISRTADGETSMLLWLMAGWGTLTILCSNIRIALDDWSLELLSQANVHLASPTCTLAEIAAGFFSFNTFLMASSLGHPNAGTNGEEVSTKPYFLITGTAFIVISVAVLLTRRNKNQTFAKSHAPSIRASYDIIFRILKLPHVWTLMLVHLTSMIGFMTNDSIAILQLVKNGYTDRDIAGLATISIPLELIGGVFISRLIRKHHPLHIWRKMFPYRLLVALTTQVGVLLVNHYRAHHWRWFISLFPYLVSKQFEDMMFIALLSFHAQISDPVYGGIYLPLLATTLNIRYDLMGLIFTKTIGWIDGGEGMGAAAVAAPGENNGPAGAGAGTGAGVGNAVASARVIDGYQIVNLCAVIIAVPVFFFFLRPATLYLQNTERSDWRVRKAESVSGVGDGDEDEDGDGNGEAKGEYVRVDGASRSRDHGVDLDLDADSDGDGEVENGSRDRNSGLRIDLDRNRIS